MLIPDKATSIDKTQPLANTGIERISVITATVLNLVPATFEIVAKLFDFLDSFSLLAFLSEK